MAPPYSWLIAPNDGLQVDRGTPTRMPPPTSPYLWRTLAFGEEITITDANRELAYGQWIAQLLKCQIGVDLVALYQNNPDPLPIKLSPAALTLLKNGYFEKPE